jgi:hypothetical protein
LANGHKLPAFPEWDKEAYPYYHIMAMGAPESGYLYHLRVMSTPRYKLDTPNVLTVIGKQNYKTYVFCNSATLGSLLGYPCGGDWKEGDSGSTGSDNFSDVYEQFDEIVWTSYDIYLSTKNDGNVATPLDDIAMPTSPDVIPLDGMTVIEWDGDTMGLMNLAPLGLGLYLISDAEVPYTEGSKYVAVIWNGTRYVTYPQHAELFYNTAEMGDEGFWWLDYNKTDTPQVPIVAGFNVPSSGVIGTGFMYGSSNFRTTLFAYPAASATTFDTTSFLSGLTMGLTGKGVPEIVASDTFTRGYLLGCELRNGRPLDTVISVDENGIASKMGQAFVVDGNGILTL